MADLERQVIEQLKGKSIEYALTLPCGKIKRLLELTAQKLHHIPLSREEEGVGIATGIHLGGKRTVMMIQSGGIGNSINALLSLTKVYKVPLPILISWRGIYKEKIVAQKPMGELLAPIFEAMEIPYVMIRKKEDLKKIEEGLDQTYQKQTPFGFFFSPEFWEQSTPEEIEEEQKEREKKEQLQPRKQEITLAKYKTIIHQPVMTRYDAIKGVKEYLKGKIVVSNIGIPSRELYGILDQETNFYMLGSLGMVSPIGLGLALVSKKEIVVIDGDASILYNPNTLGIIAQEKAKCCNLTILLMDNGACGSTGNQLTAAYNLVDLELLAQAYGITSTAKVHQAEQLLAECLSREKEIKQEQSRGPKLIHIILKPGNREGVKVIPLSPTEIVKRFQEKFKE
jgi:sulfopyruvate decarboxylase subunit beta